ncbi:MAG: hypothetical protein H6869_11485 [Rhodospirillales bacterium]|nr:hypothetical protein [Rhodospirillales bacterium]
MIDTDNISVITEIVDHFNTKGKNRQLTFSSFDEHHFLQLTVERSDIDANKCVEEIRKKSGINLIEIPFVWGDDDMGRFFVNPTAFNYIITSKPFIPDAKTEEHAAILMGMDGFGIVESYEVPVKKIEEIINAVKASGKDLKQISAEQATSRFIEPGPVTYDPQKISRIYSNGYDIDVMFQNGGRIDFHLPERRIMNELLDRKFNNLPINEQPEPTKQFMQTLSNRGRKLEEKFIRGRLPREFARAIAKDVKGLVKVGDLSNVFYTKMNNISWIARHDKTLSIHYKKNTPEGQSSNEQAFVYLKSEEKAQAAQEKLLKLIP